MTKKQLFGELLDMILSHDFLMDAESGDMSQNKLERTRIMALIRTAHAVDRADLNAVIDTVVSIKGKTDADKAAMAWVTKWRDKV